MLTGRVDPQAGSSRAKVYVNYGWSNRIGSKILKIYFLIKKYNMFYFVVHYTSRTSDFWKSSHFYRAACNADAV